MTARVLQVAFPFAPVHGDAVGGAEQIAHQLDRAMAASGREPLLIACDGSQSSGRLLPIDVPQCELTDAQRQRVHYAVRAMIEDAADAFQIDVIHLHGIDFLEYLPHGDAAALATLHLPPSWYPAGVFQRGGRSFQVQCVSRSQRRMCPPCAHMLEEIDNGIDVAAFGPPRRAGRRGYTLIMGRVCPEKNFHTALDASRSAGLFAALAGRVYPYELHQQYFCEQIVPRLNGFATFLGPVGFSRKRRLLAGARCLLVPSLAPETSSLVAMEALASGTPVIAFAAGALRDLVDHGVTGFLVNDGREMAEAIKVASSIDPEACRETAQRRFGRDAMIARYFALYDRLAGGSASHRVAQPLRSVRVHDAAERSPRICVETITSDAELSGLEKQWELLWQDDAGASPFQSPAWLLPWRACFGESELLALAARDGERGPLVGVLPLFVNPTSSHGQRELLTLGCGNSDYLDGIFAADRGDAVAAAFLKWLSVHGEHADVVTLMQLRHHSPLRLACADAAGDDAATINLARGEDCPALRRSDAHGSLMDAVPRSMFKRWQYYRRRLGRTGALTIDAADESSLDEAIEIFLRLHSERWTMNGSGGVLADERVKRFHRAALPGLLQGGMLRLWIGRLDGRAIAAMLVMHDQKQPMRAYCYLTGFDPALRALSLGTVMMGEAIERASAEGAVEFDFLRGREPYKHRWGAANTPTFVRQVRMKPSPGGKQARNVRLMTSGTYESLVVRSL